MGLDVIEMIMVLERELKIELKSEDVAAVWGKRKDAQVRDFVAVVEEQVKRQNPADSGSVFELVRQNIAGWGIKESEISLDSWFKRDLDFY